MYVKGKRKNQKKRPPLYMEALNALYYLGLQLFNVTNKFFAFFNNDITFRMRDQ
jgi:hypothetical protein